MTKKLSRILMIIFAASVIFVLNTYLRTLEKNPSFDSNVIGCAVPLESEAMRKPEVTQKPIRGTDLKVAVTDAPACARGQSLEEFDETLVMARKGDIGSINLVLGALNMNLEPVGVREFPRRWIGNRMRGVSFDEYQRFLYQSFRNGDCSSLLILVELEDISIVELNEEIANRLFAEKNCNNDLFSKFAWAREMQARGWRDLRATDSQLR